MAVSLSIIRCGEKSSADACTAHGVVRNVVDRVPHDSLRTYPRRLAFHSPKGTGDTVMVIPGHGLARVSWVCRRAVSHRPRLAEQSGPFSRRGEAVEWSTFSRAAARRAIARYQRV
jgi:hypothetical protein